MAIAGLGTEYSCENYCYQKTENKSKSFYKNVSSASQLTEEKNDSKVLGITMIQEEGDRIAYGMRAQYAAESTEANPIIQVTSNYGGRTVSYNVNINEVDPKNASQLEMFALCSYADDRGITDGGTFGSFQKLEYYSQNAQMNGFCSDLNGTDSFVNSKFNWESIVNSMMSVYLDASAYNQYQDGTKLMALFNKFGKNSDDTAFFAEINKEAKKIQSSKSDKKITTEELMQQLQNKMDEMYNKLKTGDTEPSFQIGGQSFTLKEWDKLLEQFDTIQDALKSITEEDKEVETTSDTDTKDKKETKSFVQEVIESLVSESTISKAAKDDSNGADKMYITWYTEEGIFCREQGQTEGYLWSIPFDNKEQYEKVLSFLNRFDKDENLKFASDENFWREFLAGKIDEEDYGF